MNVTGQKGIETVAGLNPALRCYLSVASGGVRGGT